ncbi:MAG: hypothetical protein LBF63_07070 [Treponema sp.]|jgi:hypothetical protein|nr:hypothetical protein [Treponema sp.]
MNHELTRIIEDVRKNLTAAERKQAERLYQEGCCTLLSQSPREVAFTVIPIEETAEEQGLACTLHIGEDGKTVEPWINGKPGTWDPAAYACLMRYGEELKEPEPKNETGRKYSREGMIRRVLEERREKAEKASYRIKWADNIYGDHVLTNEKGVKYTVFLRDF